MLTSSWHFDEKHGIKERFFFSIRTLISLQGPTATMRIRINIVRLAGWGARLVSIFFPVHSLHAHSTLKPWQKEETCWQKHLLPTRVSSMCLLFLPGLCFCSVAELETMLSDSKTKTHWGNMRPLQMFLETCFPVFQGPNQTTGKGFFFFFFLFSFLGTQPCGWLVGRSICCRHVFPQCVSFFFQDRNMLLLWTRNMFLCWKQCFPCGKTGKHCPQQMSLETFPRSTRAWGKQGFQKQNLFLHCSRNIFCFWKHCFPYSKTKKRWGNMRPLQMFLETCFPVFQGPNQTTGKGFFFFFFLFSFLGTQPCGWLVGRSICCRHVFPQCVSFFFQDRNMLLPWSRNMFHGWRQCFPCGKTGKHCPQQMFLETFPRLTRA